MSPWSVVIVKAQSISETIHTDLELILIAKWLKLMGRMISAYTLKELTSSSIFTD